VLSPDGRRLAYTAAGTDDVPHLFVRSLDRPAATLLRGTESASSPFWSPDGDWLGYYTPGGLKRISIESGEVRSIETDVSLEWAIEASWTEDNTILLSGQGGIYEVSADGGDLGRKTVTADDGGHPFPQLLPGGEALLFNLDDSTAPPSEWPIVIESLPSGERRVLTRGSDPRYLPGGYLVFAHRGRLMAAPFDLDRLELTAPPAVVLEDVMHAERCDNSTFNTGVAQFSVSTSGTLAYVPGGMFPVQHLQLVWVDTRDGSVAPIGSPAPGLIFPRLSPDGRRVAYEAGQSHFDSEIWVHDLVLDVAMRFESTPQLASSSTPRGDARNSPVWSPDGSEIAFTSTADGTSRLVVRPLGGGAAARVLATSSSNFPIRASSWSIDDVIAYVRSGDQAWKIWIVSARGDREPEQWLSSETDVTHPNFSPDGRWLAYCSSETGRPEVYVRSFPDGQRVHRVSSEGGTEPVWAPDGRRLFFRPYTDNWSALVTWAVDVELGEEFTRGKPRVLFGDRDLIGTVPVRNYDVTGDGSRLLTTRQVAEQPGMERVQQIEVVLDWLAEIRSASSGRRARQ
jgi:serine/threonine-protein kinase